VADWVSFYKKHNGSFSNRWNDEESLLTLTGTNGYPNLIQKWMYTVSPIVTLDMEDRDPRSSPVVSGTNFVQGNVNGKVYCLHALTGAFLWSQTLPAAIRGTCLIDGGYVYVPCMDGYLYKLDITNGNVIWGGSGSAGHTAGPIWSSPQKVGTRIIVGSDDQAVWAFNDSDGSPSWTYDVSGTATLAGQFRAPIAVWNPPLSVPQIIAPCMNGTVYVLSQTGGLIRVFRTNNSVKAPCGIEADPLGIVHLIQGSTDHTLYDWNLTTGEELNSIMKDGDWLSGVAIIPTLWAFIIGSHNWNTEKRWLYNLVYGWLKSATDAHGIVSSPCASRSDANAFCFQGWPDDDSRMVGFDVVHGTGAPEGDGGEAVGWKVPSSDGDYSPGTPGRIFSSPIQVNSRLYFDGDAGNIFSYGLVGGP
jgi:outer membrane protein assembly factor BamB